MSNSSYFALAEVAERMKLRALNAYARLYRQDALLASQIDELSETLRLESEATSPDDISEVLAFQQFASLAAQHSDRLLNEKRALSAELEAARQAAIRANGRLEAIKILALQERAQQRQRQARHAERLMSG